MQSQKIRPSTHKNFVPWYWRDWQKIKNEIIIPYKGNVFSLFQDKFHIDAEKDWERGRIKLQTRWQNCSDFCKELHTLLWIQGSIQNKNLMKIQEIVTNIWTMKAYKYFSKS